MAAEPGFTQTVDPEVCDGKTLRSSIADTGDDSTAPCHLLDRGEPEQGGADILVAEKDRLQSGSQSIRDD